MIDYSTFSDRALLQSMVVDDEDAFSTFYDRHWQELFLFVHRILQDKTQSKDIVQDIFTWLWEHRHDLKVEFPAAYLRAAARFKISNYIRSNKIRQSFFEEAALVAPSPLVGDPSDQLEAEQLLSFINELINQLPSKCREIFRLSRGERLSNREISERLGISVKTVENQMTIALRRLGASLGSRGLLLLLGLMLISRGQ